MFNLHTLHFKKRVTSALHESFSGFFRGRHSLRSESQGEKSTTTLREHFGTKHPPTELKILLRKHKAMVSL